MNAFLFFFECCRLGCWAACYQETKFRFLKELYINICLISKPLVYIGATKHETIAKICPVPTELIVNAIVQAVLYQELRQHDSTFWTHITLRQNFYLICVQQRIDTEESL